MTTDSNKKYDRYAFIEEINYTKDLANFLARIFPENFKDIRKKYVYPKNPDNSTRAGDIMNAKPCTGCGQIIQYHQGLEIVVNMIEGAGGKVGSKHDCPNRVGTFMHPYIPFKESEIDMRKQCSTCHAFYDSRALILCPQCWQIECQKCKTQWTWKLDSEKYFTVEDSAPHVIPLVKVNMNSSELAKAVKRGEFQTGVRKNKVINLVCPNKACRTTDNKVVFVGKVEFQ